ncbi:methyltransferase family protein [Ornithinimicrobium sp. W1679]|uniref:methyltransferase family protein n=1 Tax=Ornithinimicrobium sp. W1679 TaxID=3418770 RepID=UPI003CE8B22A
MAAAVGAQHARPLRLPAWPQLCGAAVACMGLGLVTAAVRERGPWSMAEPVTLVTRGLHSRSRNPMYVGCCLVQVGLACVTRNAWMLAFSPVSAALLHQSILREEHVLHERFGVEYDSYAAEVPRYW